MRFGLLVAVVASCVPAALAGGSAAADRVGAHRGGEGSARRDARHDARAGRCSPGPSDLAERDRLHGVLGEAPLRRLRPERHAEADRPHLGRRPRVLPFRRDLLADEGEPEATRRALRRAARRRALPGGRRRSGLRDPQPLPWAAGQHGLLARTWTDRPGLHRLRRPRRAGVRRATALGARPSAAGRSGRPGRCSAPRTAAASSKPARAPIHCSTGRWPGISACRSKAAARTSAARIGSATSGSPAPNGRWRSSGCRTRAQTVPARGSGRGVGAGAPTAS